MHENQIVLRRGLSQAAATADADPRADAFAGAQPDAATQSHRMRVRSGGRGEIGFGPARHQRPGDPIDLNTVTDDLLAGSVVRVRWVARTLLTLRSATGAARRRDQTAPGKEIVFDDELSSVRDFVRLPQTFQRDRRDDFLQDFRLHRGQNIGVRKSRRDAADAYAERASSFAHTTVMDATPDFAAA